MLLFVSPGDQAGVPGFNLELRLALKSTGAGGRMGGVNRAYGTQAPRASAGKPTEGEVWQHLQKEEGKQGQVPWSHPQH